MEQFDLVIVGAGWHGLTLAKTYLEVQKEAKILILDYAESIGGTWANERLYPGLKTNNIVGSYEFSDFPLVPSEYGIELGQHIPGRVVYRYLCDVCEAYGLNSRIRLNTKVESAILLPDGTWQLSCLTSSRAASGSSANPAGATQGRITELLTSKLVLATGLTSEPFMPDLTGRDLFQGPVFHAKDLKARVSELEGAEAVVVIGGNKSAWDVSYSSARLGAQTHMVMRRSGGGPSWVWPAQMRGYLRSISAMSATRMFTWLDPNPYGRSATLVRALINRTWLGRKISGFFWRHLDKKVTAINGYDDGPGLSNLKPWSSTFWMGNSLGIHNYETNWFDLAKDGRITAHCAEVSSLSERGVHLSDGTFIEADAVVCCTGWEVRPSVKFFPEDLAGRLGLPGAQHGNAISESQVHAQILRAAPVLGAHPVKELPKTLRPETVKAEISRSHEHDKKAYPSPYRLYRFTIPCDPDIIQQKNFAVVGAHITLHTAILAQAQALWVAAFFQGKIPRLQVTADHKPNFQRIRGEMFYHTEYQRIRRPKETGGTGDRCPDLVFDSIPYVDLLLSDLGLAYYRKNSWYQEITQPYRLNDFQGLVQEWLEKTR